MKRILSLILVTVMLFSLAPMAFAEAPYTYRYVLPVGGTADNTTDKTHITEDDLPAAYDNGTAPVKIAGWYNDPSFENATDFSGGVDVTNNDVILYAKGSDEECYVVTYNIDDDVTNPNPRTYKKGESLELKPAVWLGQNSDYWLDLDAEDPVPIAIISGRNANVSPCFECVTVAFDCQGKCTNPDNQTVPVNAVITDPGDPGASGFNFDGWYTSEGTKWTFSNPVTESMILRAKFWQFRVDFKNGYDKASKPDPEYVLVENNTKISAPDTTAKGHEVEGWYNDETLWNFDDPVTKDLKLTAKWEYTVTYMKNGGSGEMEDSTFDVGVSNNLRENAFTRKGYTFDNWTTESSGAGNVYADKASVTDITTEFDTGKVPLFAQWKAKKYIVNLDDNGGKEGLSTITATFDAAMPTLDKLPNRDGYVFVGYYTDKEGKGTQYYTKEGKSAKNWDIDNETATLYANWAKSEYKVTIKPTAVSGCSTSYTITATDGKQTSETLTAEKTITLKYGEKLTVKAAPSSSYFGVITDEKGNHHNSTAKGSAVTYDVDSTKLTGDITIGVTYSTNPVTGDEFNPILWVLALSTGAAGVAVTLIAKKKRTQH